MRGADLLVQTLALVGVDRIFSLSGNQIMPVYDACIDAGIEIIHTRHEAAAVFMADAYAQLTGGIGVCLVTAAPGAANALGPLYTARQSESPVLLLTGDSPLSQDGQGAFQELDQVPMTAPLTKLSVRANSAIELGTVIAVALQTALSGRPGPVHVALPSDVLEGDARGAELPNAQDLRSHPNPMNASEVTALLKALAMAKAPLILCGPSMSNTRAGSTLTKLADAIDAPVVAMESPRGLNDPALGDFAKAFEHADLIVSLGKPIDFSLGFGALTDSNWIVIDPENAKIDQAKLNLGEKLTFAVVADPRDAALTLIEKGPGLNARKDWRAKVASRLARRNFSAADAKQRGKITSSDLCIAVQKQIAQAAQSVVISDGGEFGQWSQACTSPTYRLINGPSGAIGGALCYGVAAKKAKSDATVFALMGDGTVGFHFAEFETAARENSAFIVVIGNDQRWNAEHQIQLRDYGPDRLIGCQLSDARYDKAAAALGAHGEHVTDLADLDAALSRAVLSGKIACVNVVIEGLPAPSGSVH
ncbi:thiamine pyrophosphate-binding protein [Pseudohalocynthiibacter aestuariivivens]|jgi:thiamine pyrophosphate-dependent acetolactate synthase large subunit-like protein|uniref:Thiamine pyrophosphate-binding protein n=1 Tax=Pseudohalocynthiibacter aestuariivivens TaxID=1591409 RepID=A0ABV5JAV7_9RHOB|nr:MULTISPECIES: thiamine pyrophosphate-binding protein [Pseudohalocynthiibacter]MBS9715854.1 thiamine pyrophosphate-binding protein [Pseudohalocynthiibacter aestuariivivens]MCK0101467.1 thiamine pyrophosphate-binding protein [Pseudohalocynthiibacter sp. F2068]